MDGDVVGGEYAAHLTDADLTLLASAAGAPAPGGPPGAVPVLPAEADADWLRRDPVAIPVLLGDPRVFEAVFGWADRGRPPRPGEAVPASPFLTFAVAVHRSATELESMGHVAERTGPRQRVPLFDAPALRGFLRPRGSCSWLSCWPRSPGWPAAVTGSVAAGGPGPGGSASWTRYGWPACWTGCPTPRNPACTAGSVTCPCSWPVSSRTTPPCTGSVRPVWPRCSGRRRGRT